MTLDFTSDWKPALLAGSPYSPANRHLDGDGRVAPAYPEPAEMARLVGELFTEGTIGIEQLRAFAHMPELRPHLQQTLAALPRPDRVARTKP